MQLIDEIEISYFRSFYKIKLRDIKDLNIIFGKNDSGKSNIVRALNLFFNFCPDHDNVFEFPIDFNESRAKEANESEDVRKFLYVKVTFNTPPNYKRSLGKRFYVKRQWTVTKGEEYTESFSSNIPQSRRHIARRLLNKIRFIYIPAIKDVKIFEMLLSNIHEVISGSSEFIDTVGALTENLHQLTQTMFDSLPPEVAASTKIGAPNRMNQMFQTLDFETLSQGEQSPKSLTRQRGDGIKVRHIPELLKFISNGDKYDFHIWGFEEPENSLDFAAAQSEATRFKTLAMSKEIQVFMTTHSPSFYLLDGENVQQFYIIKDSSGDSKLMQGRDIQNLDPLEAMEEGFYLPAVAASLKDLAEFEARAKEAERNVERLKAELEQIARPVVLTEGRTDAMIIQEAWRKRMNDPMPFEVRSCETGGENAGSGDGGAQRLAIRIKGVAHDHPHPVLALFDRDAEGIAAFGLDKNFIKVEAEGFSFKRAMHGRAYAACLPIPDFRDDCGELNNLPIEFMFPDEVLSKEHEGRSLRLKVKEASVKFGEQVIRRPLENETRYKIVTGGKDVFANQIVPNLPAEDFSAFDELFKMIDTILKFDASRHNLQANAT